MKRLLLLFIIPLLGLGGNRINDMHNLDSIKPMIDLGVGFPWLINFHAGGKLDNHKILLKAKSYFIYNHIGMSYSYYFTKKNSVGLELAVIKKNSLFNSLNRKFFTLSPHITYEIKASKKEISLFRKSELTLGFQISKKSDFGFRVQNNNVYVMPYISFSIPFNLKKSKKVNPEEKLSREFPKFHSIKKNYNYLSDFENSIKSNNDLLKKYSQFKKDGIENDFSISNTEMENIIEHSKSYIGTPYEYGGDNKSGIDCSGLFYNSFTKENINLPRIAQDIARLGNIIYDQSQLVRGDFVFFANTTSANKLITHMGLYLGKGDFIHSSSSKGVIISKINDPYYWKEKFLFGKRILK